MFEFGLIESILGIVIIDVVLSGDNAVVIAMATRLLAPSERRRAILLGAVGAIALRVLCTVLVVILLGIPLLQAAGGLLLLWIAYKLLRQREQTHAGGAGGGLGEAVRTIIVADAVMSLDNMLAVGGAAHGNIALLLFGLALSMPIIVFGSGLIARILDRLPWLLDDPLVDRLYPDPAAFAWAGTLLLLACVLALGYWRNRRDAAYPTRLPGATA